MNRNPSFKDRLVDRILTNPTLRPGLRKLAGRWMGLSTGPYTVTITSGAPIPMRDGTVLAADLYQPLTAESMPTLVVRTPYNRTAHDTPIGGIYAWHFASYGYNVVMQDVRGCFGSGGVFVPFIHEADDGADTLAWVTQQPWCNGTIGMWGASYLGYVQWAAAAAGRPELKALMPMLTRADLMHHNENGFPLDLLLRWMFSLVALNEPGLPYPERVRRIHDAELQDGYLMPAFFHLPLLTADEVAIGQPSELYREMAEAGADHRYWDMVDHTNVVATGPRACFLGGWHDIFLDGLLADFERQQAAGLRSCLLVGPWSHLDYEGYVSTSFDQGLAWFDYVLKGNPTPPQKKPVRLYVQGAGEWRDEQRWPPPSTTVRLYLQGNGAAKTGRLFLETPAAGAAPDPYRYDPADPTPNLGGPKLAGDAGPVDNRPLEQRADVLVYSTPPLRADLEIVGYVAAELYVRSSLPSADFFVRLTDVDVQGRSLNVCDGIVRVEPGRGELLTDGVVRVTVPMSATAYRFKSNHRLRVQVASGAHPRFARNLGAAGNQATLTTLTVADQIVYHDLAHPSALLLPVVAGGVS